MIKSNRQYRSVPSFDDVMKQEQAKPIPSFDEIMGTSSKKKVPTISADVSGGASFGTENSKNTSSSSELGKSNNVYDPVKEVLDPLRSQYAEASNQFNPLRNRAVSDQTRQNVLPVDVKNRQFEESDFGIKQKNEQVAGQTLKQAQDEIHSQLRNVKNAKQVLAEVKEKNGGVIPNDNETVPIVQKTLESFEAANKDNALVKKAASVDNFEDFVRRYSATPINSKKDLEEKAYEALNDPNVEEAFRLNPNKWKVFLGAKNNTNNLFPERTKQRLSSQIAQWMDETNKGGGFIKGSYSKRDLDATIEKQYKLGKINAVDRAFYYQNIKPSDVPTTAAANVFGRNYESALRNSFLGRAISKVGLLENPTEKYKYQAQVDPKRLLGKSAELTGQLTPMILTTAALGGAGFSNKAANLISTVNQFGPTNEDKANELFPNDPAKKWAYTILGSGIDALATELPIFKSGIFKEEAQNLAATLADNTINNSVKEQAKRTFLKRVQEFAGSAIKNTAHGSTVLTGLNTLHKILDVAADAPNAVENLKHTNFVEEFLNNAKSYALLGGLQAAGKLISENKIEPNDNAELKKAIDELPDSMYGNVLKNASEAELPEHLKSIAEQLNDPESATTTRKVFGDKISDIALKLYPDARTEKPDITGSEENIPTTEQGVVGEPSKTIETVSGRSGESVGDEKPSDEQQLRDIQNGDVVTFTYNSEAEVPEVFKDKISSKGETNGKPIVRVTVPKSLAEYELSKSNTQSGIKPTESKETIPEQVQNKTNENTIQTKKESTPIAEPNKNIEPTEKTKERQESITKKAAKVDENELRNPYEKVLYYFANGGKINSGSIKEIFGGGGKNVQGEQNSRIGLIRKDAPTIDQLSHQLWENVGSPDNMTTMDFRDAIEQVIQNHNSHSSAARELIGMTEAVKNELTADEARQHNDASIKKLEQSVSELPEAHQEEIINLLKKYQDKYGFIDWERLEKDTNGFDPEILSLPQETQNSLYGLVEKYIQSGQGESPNINSQNGSQEKTETSPEQPIRESGQGIEPPTAEGEPVSGNGGGRDKGVLTHLAESKNLPEATRKGFIEHGLKYEPKSQEESRKIAQETIDAVGIDDAVLNAEASKFQGGVNSAIFGESLNRLFEQETKAKTPEEKLEAAKKFAEVSIRYDEWARKGGRDIAQINDFYKKSPLGIAIAENAKRAEGFKEWAKSKEKSWKEIFDEISNEPEVKAIIEEQVKEGMKKERAESRKARIDKVDKTIDKWIDDIEKGNIAFSSVVPPKLIVEALKGMKAAYHAGEKIAKVIEDAVEVINEKMGGVKWDSEKFKKKAEELLKETEPKKKKFTDEELKNKVLDKFRKKLKGLTDKEKEEVVRRAFKEIVENGGLNYDDFKKIIADVTGRGEMTAEEVARIKELVEKTNSVEEAAKKVLEERTDEALVKYRASQLEAAKASKELNEMLWDKPHIMRRLTSIMQLNTLGIPALVNNPIYNVWNQMTVRFPTVLINDVIDRAIAGIYKLGGKNYEREYNTLETQMDFFRGLGLGTKESLEQFLTGLNRQDYIQKEVYGQQIRPFKSIKDLAAWKMGNKKLTQRQVVDKALQATAGIPAEIVARVLNIGDKPQRFGAEQAQGAAFAKALGLKGMDYKLFMEFPREEAVRAYKKQGLSEEAANQKAEYIKSVIIKEGERSTFQQDNMLNDLINKVFGGRNSGVGQFAKSLTISPFIKIPSNAFWSAYNLINPELAIVQAMWHGRNAYVMRNKGDNSSALQLREARYWFAHAVVGIALRAAIIPLVKAGIYTSSNTGDDTKKEREGEAFYGQQGALNITKLAVLLRGGDPSKVRGGLTVQNRWFGQWGVVGNTIAKKFDDMTPEQRKEQGGFWDAAFGGLEKDGLGELQNGVFSNTSALLSAFDSKGSFGFNNYMRNTIGFMENTVHPAMFAQVSRQQLPYYTTSKADNFLQQIKNDVLTRSGWIRKLTGQYPPSKISIWGEPLMRKDNVAMRLFGISNEDKDNFAYPIYQDAKETGDIGFFPPSVSPILNGFKLNTQQQNLLETYIGQARKSFLAPYINDMATIDGFDKQYSQIEDKEMRKKVVGYLYELGRMQGVNKFLEDYPQFKKPDQTDLEQEMNGAYEIFKKSVQQ